MDVDSVIMGELKLFLSADIQLSSSMRCPKVERLLPVCMVHGGKEREEKKADVGGSYRERLDQTHTARKGWLPLFFFLPFSPPLLPLPGAMRLFHQEKARLILCKSKFSW